MPPYPTSWSVWRLTYRLFFSFQRKLQLALEKLRKQQELAEKLEVDVATKRAEWKARVKEEGTLRRLGKVQGPRGGKALALAMPVCGVIVYLTQRASHPLQIEEKEKTEAQRTPRQEQIH